MSTLKNYFILNDLYIKGVNWTVYVYFKFIFSWIMWVIYVFFARIKTIVIWDNSKANQRIWNIKIIKQYRNFGLQVFIVLFIIRWYILRYSCLTIHGWDLRLLASNIFDWKWVLSSRLSMKIHYKNTKNISIRVWKISGASHTLIPMLTLIFNYI